MKNVFMKFCSILMAAVMVANMLPLNVFAADNEIKDLTSQETTQEILAESEIIEEITENRTEYKKEFRLSNGLVMAAVYPNAVHYEENGQWNEIDNTLKMEGTGSSQMYRNTAGIWDVCFPQQLNRLGRISITKDGYTLRFGMAGELRQSGNLEIAGGVEEEQMAAIESTVPEVTASEETLQDVTLPEMTVTPETAATETTLPGTEIIETTAPDIPAIETTTPEIEIFETDVTIPEETMSPELTVPEATQAETSRESTSDLNISDNLGSAETFAVTQMQSSVAQPQQIDLQAAKDAAQHEIMVAEKLNSGLLYTNVFGTADLRYDLSSNKVKESVIIKSYSSTLRGYRYTLEVGDMIPVLQESGRIDFYDSGKESIVMVMDAPFLVDASMEYNYDVQVQLTGSGSTYTLTYLLPQQWLSSAERQWPVVLDPVISATLSVSNIRDQSVAENTTYDYTRGINECGFCLVDGIQRFFLKYREIPVLKSSDVVIGAAIQMYKLETSNTTATVQVHKVLGTWESETITWANKPGYDPTIEDYAIVRELGYYSWDVTDIVRGWYSGANTGMMFRVDDNVENNSTSNNWKQFCSADYSTNTALMPSLVICFRNNNGLESYWDYTVSSAGRAGTGYINNYTGNLVFIRDDFGIGGNRMPVTIRHIYNANDSSNNEFGLGNGWRSSYSQKVYQWSENSNYYVWEDSDGTSHYFKYSSENTYKDEDGLGLTLTTGSNDSIQKYCIFDKDYNALYFDIYGRLRKLEINQQTTSSINITYTSTSGMMISSITDGAGRSYRYFYSNGLLTHAVYRGKGTVNINHVVCGYSGTQLISLTDTDGTVTQYGYTNGVLSSATDSDGYKLTYTYNTPSASYQPYRVLSVSESDGTALGGALSIEYAHNQTTFTDHNGNVEIHQFNNFGNTVCIQDSEGRAQYTQYAFDTDDEKTNNTDATKKGNQIRLSSKLQNTVGNRFRDGSFENGTVWTPHGSNVSTSVTTETAYLGSYSQKIVNSAYTQNHAAYSRNFAVYAGETVTASAYVKNPDSHTTLEMHYHDSVTGTYPKVTSPVADRSDDWQRIEVTFTNTTGSTQWVYIHLRVENPGTYYVDCVQVEKSETASRYNLVENGDFWYNSSWTANTNSTSADTRVSETAPATSLQANVWRITGSPTQTRSVSQTINVSGNAGDTYVLAGWAKGDSVPLNNEDAASGIRRFCLKAIFWNTDGSKTERVVSFNPDTNATENWQYAAAPVVADKAYNSIQVAAVYDYNANTVYFDGIQLFKEQFGNSYTYDADGNVKSVVDLQKQTTTYEYDSDNNLTKVLQNNKAKMTYSYDNYKNVVSATSEEGVVYNFEYDTYGNNTSVSIGGKITATATYSADGNRLVSTTDALGKVTTYGYNEITNELDWVQYPEDTEATRTNYTYDSIYRLASAACRTDTGCNLSVSYTYANDLLTSIQTGSTTYSFSYGDFSLRTGVSIGTRSLATYSYTNDRNNYLASLDYGNGDSVDYTYDAMGRVTLQTYEDGSTVAYKYDNNGALAKVTDSETGITTTYYYDFTDRLMQYTEKGTGYSHKVGYTFDAKNNLTAMAETINGTKYTTSYTYDDDNRIVTVSDGNAYTEYIYDSYGRLCYTRYYNDYGAEHIFERFDYYSPSDTTTSAQVYNHHIFGDVGLDHTYTYDDNGNILSCTEYDYFADSTKVTSYAYDSANQLIRENNEAGGFTYVWSYDHAGNILERIEYAYTTGSLEGVTPTDIVTYTYGDNAWGDLLTVYNGQTITSDTIGNMLTDGTWTYTWKQGRQLATMSDGTTTWTYTYNADGLRTKRTNGTKTYSYVYNGSQLSQMTVDGNTAYFTYDALGKPMTMLWGGETYHYITNMQGDVIGITDNPGNLTLKYTYDAWGNLLSTTGNLVSIIGDLNPLRYRGYVYDSETGLYYLQSRYYDPELGRFINADAFAATGQGILGNNMFAYCGNNPVFYCDSSGTRAIPALRAEMSTGKSKLKESISSPKRDVTKEVGDALLTAAEEAQAYRAGSDALLGDSLYNDAFVYLQFYQLVNHEAPWDIKRQQPWESTIGTPFPGYDVEVVFGDIVMTPENLGNFTYGYLGYAYGIPLDHLFAGSYYAAGFPTENATLGNELFDWVYIAMGYNVAENAYVGR